MKIAACVVGVVGVPAMVPSLFSVSPAGRVPLMIVRYCQDSCALSDSPIGPPSGAATPPAE